MSDAMDTLRTFRLIGREFDNVSDDEVREYLDLFAPMVSRRKFGNMYEMALAYYTAHKMKLRGMGGAEDEARKNAALNMGVASYSEGDTSISYTTPASSGSTDTDAELTLTIYGIEYMRIVRSAIISATI